MSENNTGKVSFSFPKKERLYHRTLIRELFQKGSSFYLFPFKVIFLPYQPADEAHHQILVSVPKRLFKKAVDRNRLKRQIKESYRLQKHHIHPSVIRKSYLIAYIYTHKQKLDSSILYKKLGKVNQKILELHE